MSERQPTHDDASSLALDQDDPLLAAFAQAPPMMPRVQAIGRVLDDRYEILDHLKEGGMADIFRALDRRTGVEVAVKRSRVPVADPAERKHRVTALQRDLAALKRAKHRDVVRILDIVTWDDEPCLVLDLLQDGEIFSATIAREGPLPALCAVRILRRVAEALKEIHARGVIHRDLKPSNLWLHQDGSVTVIDFGLALLLPDRTVSSMGPTSTRREQWTIAGTPEYMAPEQWGGQAQDERTDIFAIGVTLFHALTKHLPFRTPKETIGARAPLLSSYVQNVDEALQAVVSRCLAANPHDRYQSAAELADALGRLEHRLTDARGSTPPVALSTGSSTTMISPKVAGATAGVPVIAVMGTQGGAGKSTFIAAAAELIASTGSTAVIVDVDLETAGVAKYTGSRARKQPRVTTALDLAYQRSDPRANVSASDAAWDVTPGYLMKPNFGKVLLIPARMPEDTRSGYEALANVAPDVRNAVAIEILSGLVQRAASLGGVVLIDCGAENNPIVSAAFILASYAFLISRPTPEARTDVGRLRAMHAARYPGQSIRAMSVVVNQALPSTTALWEQTAAHFLPETPELRAMAARGTVDFEGIGLNAYYRALRGILASEISAEHQALVPDEAAVWIRPYLKAMKQFPQKLLERPRLKHFGLLSAVLLLITLAIVAGSAYAIAFSPRGENVVTVVDLSSTGEEIADGRIDKDQIPPELRDRVLIDSKVVRLRGMLSHDENKRLREAVPGAADALIEASVRAEVAVREANAAGELQRQVAIGGAVLGLLLALWTLWNYRESRRRRAFLRGVVAAIEADDDSKLDTLLRRMMQDETCGDDLLWLRDEFRQSVGILPG